MDLSKTIKREATLRAATPEDAEAVAELFNACSLEMFGRPELAAEELRAEWQIPGFSLATDTQAVLTPEGRLIGYGDLWGTAANFVRFTSWVRVHPQYRGQGIGTYLNQFAEARAGEQIEKAPEGARVVLQSSVWATDARARELLQFRGMAEVRHSWRMEIEFESEPSPPRWPEGITVRTRRADEGRAIYEADRTAFRDHWGVMEEPSEEGFARWRHMLENNPDYDPSLWFLAEEGEQIIGFSICTPRTAEDPDMGWIHSLGVLRPWRRRGVGLALLLHTFGEFYHRGLGGGGLGVDAENLTGATRLYEKAGMRVVREYVLYEKTLRPGREMRIQSVWD